MAETKISPAPEDGSNNSATKEDLSESETDNRLLLKMGNTLVLTPHYGVQLIWMKGNCRDCKMGIYFNNNGGNRFRLSTFKSIVTNKAC